MWLTAGGLVVPVPFCAGLLSPWALLLSRDFSEQEPVIPDEPRQATFEAAGSTSMTPLC